MSLRRTLPEILLENASSPRGGLGFTFVDEHGREELCSFEELASETARHARALLERGLRRGDRVVLALPTGKEFVVYFLGAMHAGLVPVPIYPPYSVKRIGPYLEHARHIVAVSEAALVVTSAKIKKILGSLMTGPLRDIASVDELETDGGEAPLRKASLSDVAFLQFTSGSTTRPRGVTLTYETLAANVDGITGHGLGITPDDVGCSWLPLYHDMGLIGFVLAPITTATPVVLMPPMLFLKRPVEWLRVMSRHGATIAFSPDFGYGLTAARVRERDLEALSLSRWRVAGCGAEPIQMSTLETFAKKFEPAGFRREAFMLCYGLAESTLAVSFAPGGGRADRVRVDRLAEGEARPTDAVSAVTLASCGRRLPGHEWAIVDEAGRRCPPRRVGEIVLRGPSIMKGYFNDPEETRRVLRDGWLHTGDLGYLVDDELFVCGRQKDLIISAGRNYHPVDVEWIVSAMDGIRRGQVVAFGLRAPEGDGRERVVVCAETKLRERAEVDALASSVASRVLEDLGLNVDEVVLLPPGRLPKTYSGKLQRSRVRERYRRGKLAASRDEGRLSLVRHLLGSQWGFFKNRVLAWTRRGEDDASIRYPIGRGEA